jgi:hypothetical protein
MNQPTPYTPSKLLGGDAECLRQNSMTRWMSRDMTQASVDFCKNIGLFPAYCECSTEHLTRYLFWRLPSGAAVEVRSGRARDKFEELDRVNRVRGWRLVSLHVNDNELYSGVWVSEAHTEAAKTFLAAHGILLPERRTG